MTSAVATLSVAVAVAGHVLAGGSAPLAVVPQLLALAAIAWSFGEHVSGRRWLSVGVLAAIQVTTHLTLDSGHLAAPATAAAEQPPMDHAAMGHSSMHDMAGMAPAGAGPGGLPGAGESAGSMHGGLADVLAMSAAHLLVLLVGVALIGSTHRWVQRVVRILARLVPQLPASAVAVPSVRAALPGVPEQPHLTQRWLTSGVSRRGPPRYGLLTALS